MIQQQIKDAIRDIHDFPKPGIIFKDITPILKDPALCSNITDAFLDQLKGAKIDAIAGVESRGFLFGLTLATKLGVPFIPVRKAGKLPHTVNQKVYELEYGTATIEIHTDAFNTGDHILIHDPWVEDERQETILDAANIPVPHGIFMNMAQFGRDGLRAAITIGKR